MDASRGAGSPRIPNSLFSLFLVLAKGLGRNVFHRSAPAYLLAKPMAVPPLRLQVAGTTAGFRAGFAEAERDFIQTSLWKHYQLSVILVYDNHKSGSQTYMLCRNPATSKNL